MTSPRVGDEPCLGEAPRHQNRFTHGSFKGNSKSEETHALTSTPDT